MPIRIAAVDLPRHQDQSQHQAEACGLHFTVGKAAQADKSGGIGHHQFRVPQSDEGDEEADSGGGGMLQAIGHAVDDLLANARDGEQKKDHAGKENHAQRGSPGNVHAQANRVGEVGVERHSRRERDGIVGVKSHHQRGDRGGKASCEDHALERHSRLGQDLRIHHDDVGHRQESGEATEKFLPYGGLIFGELEITIEQSVFPRVRRIPPAPPLLSSNKESCWAFLPRRGKAAKASSRII